MFKRLTFLLLVGFVTQGFAAEFSVKAKTIPAQRIIALAPHIVESSFDIGAGGQIVATVDYADYPAQALDIPRVGGFYGLQIEKILELKPDLVIIWRSGNKDQDIEKMEKLGLNVVYSDANDIDGVSEELITFGELTGHQENAQAIAKQYSTRLSRLRNTYQNKPSISTFYQLWSEPLMSVNKNTWIHQLITACGASNVFADNSTDYPQLSIENVIVAKPQLIIIPQENSKKPQPKIDWQQWQVIPAVKNNQFMEVDADLVHRFSVRMLSGLEDMCQKIDLARQALSEK